MIGRGNPPSEIDSQLVAHHWYAGASARYNPMHVERGGNERLA
jgi:hypothetical protein